MADRKKSKKKQLGVVEEEKLSKTNKSVLKWLRKNVPIKKTKFMHSHVVEYFTSAKAIDALVNDSPWSKEKAKEGSELILETRFQAIDLLDVLLRNKMFHRAKKITVAEKEKKKKKDEEEEKVEEEEKKDLKQRKKKKKEDEKEAKENKEEKERAAEREKKKRKIRLEMHNEQVIIDGNEAYVWLYDPTPWYYYIAGSAIVLGIIAVCLFPLWPAEMRQGVYYLSVGAAGFLVFIICLAIIKYIIFLALFICTAGKLKFWIFPNLTEDVGFIESFKPAYVYTYTGPKKENDSDDESESEDEDEEDEEGKNEKGAEVSGDGDGEGSDTGRDDQGNGSEEENSQGSESGGSSREFEIIDNKQT
ncbi:translocation protein SEC62 [Eurytemora carolleeae]|uniref:translocation protein SEC62 n=1 Tax=Eurytemora carolleeae TaxID=1294199 RepID=UPI000C77755B|nr:translocation protein SEC62 [Eurytemora carolleeae]|eukprot:XP_023324400.1 translocation protein SEC62-like [Eurytemora affinis]